MLTLQTYGNRDQYYKSDQKLVCPYCYHYSFMNTKNSDCNSEINYSCPMCRKEVVVWVTGMFEPGYIYFVEELTKEFIGFLNIKNLIK